MTGSEVALLCAGGGTGAVCRHTVGRLVGERYQGAFPLGTCAINISGCFFIGLVATVIAAGSHATLLSDVLVTGFLGGYTTFSTYALEGLVLALDGAPRTAAASMIVPVVVGLPAAGLGAYVGHLW